MACTNEMGLVELENRANFDQSNLISLLRAYSSNFLHLKTLFFLRFSRYCCTIQCEHHYIDETFQGFYQCGARNRISFAKPSNSLMRIQKEIEFYLREMRPKYRD
ncbi:Prolyl 4-hydroxylase subunit alpha-2 [Sarcoptes scabiei]|nr:Prolyl 4-hydroxylase subunit alpha-2 [Sarcoptes scabiei]